MLTATIVSVVASFSLLRATERAYRRVLSKQLETLGTTSSPKELPTYATHLSSDEVQYGVVTSSVAAHGINQKGARDAARHKTGELPVVAVPLRSERGAYLIARFAPGIPESIAYVELSRMAPLVLLSALAAAALFGFMIGRLLFPYFSWLMSIAQTTRPSPQDTDEIMRAPNEVLAVAQRFQRTVNQLNREREKIEEEKAQIEAMQEGLVRASKLASVGRLAAGVAHEIGNPLAAVRGYVSLVEGGLSKEQERDVLARSAKELERISDTIKKLLAYARGGEEKETEHMEFSLSDVIKDTLSLVRGHPVLRDVEITNNTAEQGLRGYGHPEKFGQVLVNLILNAAQAMKNTRTKKIVISGAEEKERSHILVTDNGPGIDMETQAHIFDPFFTTKAPGEGTGLGLAVSRSLMEGMGGDLLLVEQASGAQFAVQVPRFAKEL